MYSIIGSGRMARHFQHYLKLLNIPFDSWHRGLGSELVQKSLTADRVLMLISDDAIEGFIESHPWLKERTLVHFSGRLVTPLAFSAHPLQTFGAALYDLDAYRKVPFVIEAEGPALDDLLPMLPNRSARISRDQKTLYHASCVIGGNFSVLLWQKMIEELTAMGVPSEFVLPYLEQTLQNFANDPRSALTGPLARGDRKTIECHKEALKGDPFLKVYEAMVEAYGKGSGPGPA